MSIKYTDEKNVQILLALLKKHNIKKAVISPGTANITFVKGMQDDSYFELFSSVDERSAAFLAGGLSYESNEPIILTCTGATASRNYLPGLTDAYYRKLPILAITATKELNNVNQLIPQVIDRSILPKDVVNLSVHLNKVKDDEDWFDCEIKINKALLELKRNGGGPVHINLTTTPNRSYTTEKLPEVKVINRVTPDNELFPEIKGKVGIFIGSHKKISPTLNKVIDDFCESNNAVVFCDHTSSYKGKFRVLYSLSAAQRMTNHDSLRPDLTIHIGEITGEYSTKHIIGKTVWRVSEDGEIKDTFRKLSYVFEMSEFRFFQKYIIESENKTNNYLNQWQNHLNKLYQLIPELPFSNIWVAKTLHNEIPDNSTIHFAILNSLRSWNFFEISNTIESQSNVGGFGIDGCMSSLIGASLANSSKLYFLVIGDLAFFYDLNSIGNRHIKNNIRILLINNGVGTEFKNFNHPGDAFGKSTDEYIAAGRHFGNKSKAVVKNFCEALGFEYLSAENKDEFNQKYHRFIQNEINDKPIIFEVFTDSKYESKALKVITSIQTSTTGKAKNVLVDLLGKEKVKKIKKIIRNQ